MKKKTINGHVATLTNECANDYAVIHQKIENKNGT
jgi:hypothetical protein